jgi:signal transduction histidine kinase
VIRTTERPLDWWDAVLAPVLFVWAAAANRGEPFSLALLLLTAPVLVRRRFPTAAAAAMAAGIGLSSVFPIASDATLPVILAGLAVAYSVAAHARWPWIGLILLLVPLLPLANDRFSLPVPAWTLPFVLIGSAWLAGVTVRRRAQAAVAWRERAEAIEREQAAGRAAALAEERARIARELHDVVTHRVSLMVIQAGAARSVLASTPEVAVEQLVALEAGGREALAELRGALDLLATSTDPVSHLGPAPGLAALAELVARTREAGLPVKLEVTGEQVPVPSRVDLTAYRVVQEALTNALRHSNHDGTSVTVHYGERELTLDVVDASGPPGSVREGRGLVGMRERVALCLGSLEAGPRPGRGFGVLVRLPLEPA